MILLDTHVLLWLVDGDRRLGAPARALIDNDQLVFFSAVSAWEIGMLVSQGKINLTMTPEMLFRHLAGVSRVREFTIGAEVALDAGSMPRTIHGDPCDRIIMASARGLDCPLVTADEKILRYSAAGHLKAIDARV